MVWEGWHREVSPYPDVCPACSIAWGWKSPVQPDGGEGLAKHKGTYCEVVSEGSVEQNRDLTNRNRIQGIPGRTSGPLIAKSISIEGHGCRSGRGAGKAIELTWGGLCRVPIPELREPRGDLTATQESADGIVGQAVGKASEALQGRKAEQRIGRAGNDGRRPERLGVASRTGNS